MTNPNWKKRTWIYRSGMTISWKIELFFLSILWFFRYYDANRPPGQTKGWKDFKYGLINHPHIYTPDFYHVVEGTIFYDCHHVGCNLVQPEKMKWETREMDFATPEQLKELGVEAQKS